MTQNSLVPIRRITGAVAVAMMLTTGGGIISTIPNSAYAAVPANLPDFTELFEKNNPSVVNIRTTEKVNVNPNAGDEDPEMELFRRFFGVPIPRQNPNPKNKKQAPQQQQEEIPRGVGSGFIISQDGYILTNAHVVEGASEVYVKLSDKRELKAKVIGTDSRTDVALIKIEGSKLPKVTIGESEKVKAGEWVIAIGSPFDLENTITAGIVSAKARETGDFLPLIQTDVAVNPGNSGGPLINMRGEVIGINSQIFSRSGGYMGISFAIPINEAMRIVEQLKSNGKVSRGYLGIEQEPVTKEIAESLKLSKPAGSIIRKVLPGTPAEKGGVEVGDVVLKVNGINIEKPVDLSRAVGDIKPGGKANVTVWRKGALKELTITVAEFEADKPAKANKKSEKSDPAVSTYGLTVADMTEAQKRDLGVRGGVVVEQVEGGAARRGLRPGDVILRVGDSDVRDLKEFNALLAKQDLKKPLLVLIKRGDVASFTTIMPNN